MSAAHTAERRATNRLEVLDPPEAERWARQLRATAHPCGCKQGAASSLFALVAWPVFVVVSGRAPHSIFGALAAIVIYGIVIVVAGAAGKVAGIVAGRRRHVRLQHQLSRRLALVAQQNR